MKSPVCIGGFCFCLSGGQVACLFVSLTEEYQKMSQAYRSEGCLKDLERAFPGAPMNVFWGMLLVAVVIATLNASGPASWIVYACMVVTMEQYVACGVGILYDIIKETHKTTGKTGRMAA